MIYSVCTVHLRDFKFESDDNVTVFAAFDNEEVGSGTKQGAKSSFCVMCLKEFAIIRKRTKEPLLKALCYRATMLMRCIRILRTKSDGTNRVYMNGGIVIKYNANQKIHH